MSSRLRGSYAKKGRLESDEGYNMRGCRESVDESRRRVDVKVEGQDPEQHGDEETLRLAEI